MIRKGTGLPGSLQWLHYIWLTSVLRQVIWHYLCSFDYAAASEVKRTDPVPVFTDAETHLHSGPSSHKAGIPCLWSSFPQEATNSTCELLYCEPSGSWLILRAPAWKPAIAGVCVCGGGSAIGTSVLEENCDFSGEHLHFFSSLGRSPSRTGNMLCLCPHFIPSLEDTAKGLFMNDEWMQKASWYRILSSDLIQLSIYEPSTALSSRCPSGHIYLFLLLSLCPWA